MDMRLEMRKSEMDALCAFLQNSRRYVEFGAGGSTVLACRLCRESVVSVDTNRAWLDELAVACAQCATMPRLVYADIGPTGSWGEPVDDSCIDRWPSYHACLNDVEEAKDADFYFVDGRFRVASFCRCLLLGRSDSLFAIHDYSARPHYHCVEALARPIAHIDRLAIFVRRHDFDASTCRAMITAYEKKPD